MKTATPANRPAPTRQGLAPQTAAAAPLVTYKDINGNELQLSTDIIKQYLCPSGSLTDAEAYMFLSLCRYQGLNPFLREVYACKYGNGPATMIVGKETFTKRAQKNPKYKGSKAGVVVLTKDGKLENRVGEIVLPDEELVGGWADVYVDGYVAPITATVNFTERCQYKDGKPASKWATSPGLMIRKCALVAALREAFPAELGGMYSAEEQGYEEVAATTTPIDASKVLDVDPDTGEITGGAQDDVEASFFAQEG